MRPFAFEIGAGDFACGSSPKRHQHADWVDWQLADGFHQYAAPAHRISIVWLADLMVSRWIVASLLRDRELGPACGTTAHERYDTIGHRLFV
jgi:hypothetical protein